MRLMNVTEFTNTSLQAVLDEILEFGGWAEWPNGRIVMRHPPKGVRVRRVKFNWRHDNGGYLLEVTMSRTCTGLRLGQDLHWHVAKNVFKDDPGRWLHQHTYPDLVKKTKLAQGQQPARDIMQERHDKAAAHVVRLGQEIVELKAAIERKRKLVKKWAKKKADYARRLRYRPKAKAKADKRRKAEKDWKERVQKKAQAMKESLDDPA